ncbi:hypothetical protein OG417_05220 [Actinoallomurus sp. NBC_01490]|uniref:hypothetical protein n=1 Tax=Actinoallomurus sp. NBC_01490 TaxID=2903557 RepID=UPI002E335343|nr:hypothetical protein [Actinoallomurus sp. NBC_01490]
MSTRIRRALASSSARQLIIDAHSHVHDPVADHVALLDEAGVDRAVLFMTRPHPERATDLVSLRREMAILAARPHGRGDHADAYQAVGAELDAALRACTRPGSRRDRRHPARPVLTRAASARPASGSMITREPEPRGISSTYRAIVAPT